MHYACGFITQAKSLKNDIKRKEILKLKQQNDESKESIKADIIC